MSVRLWCVGLMFAASISLEPLCAQLETGGFRPSAALSDNANPAPPPLPTAPLGAGGVGSGTNNAEAAARPAPPITSVAGEETTPRQPHGRAPSLAPTSGSNPTGITRRTKGTNTLPNNGQTWWEYDITPYTNNVQNNPKPQQAIVDWILRETGTDAWFTGQLGILHANKQKLTVYHTPEMHDVVRGVVDRFVASRAESHVLSLRLMTVGSPNWRTKAMQLMTPVNVQSPGVDAWLLSKENAAILTAELSKRIDFYEHNSPSLIINNGQTQTIARTRPRSYLRSVRWNDGTWPSHRPEMAQLNEGYSLQISPLFSIDGRSIDAAIKCHIDQVEKLVPLTIDVPSFATQPQRIQIQVPQLVSWRLHERFRWPADHVLLLSCGVVASPNPEKADPLGLNRLIGATASRADALLMIESRGTASQSLMVPERSANNGMQYRNRY